MCPYFIFVIQLVNDQLCKIKFVREQSKYGFHSQLIPFLVHGWIQFVMVPNNCLLFINQSLLESMGANGSTGPEAVAAAEKNAALLTSRAGARDPSAVPSICRISASLQYPAG